MLIGGIQKPQQLVLYYEKIVKFSTPKTVYYFGRYSGLNRNDSFSDISRAWGFSHLLRPFGLVDSEISFFFKSTVVRDANGQNGAIVRDITR